MSTLSLFLNNKKVRLNSEIDLTKIINILKINEIDTQHIEDKPKLHSLFFTENDTLFLKEDVRADQSFKESFSEEITLNDFLNLIDYSDKDENIEEQKPNVKQKNLKSKYLKIQKDNNVIFYRKKKIKSVRFLKEKEQIIISLKAIDFSIENANEEDYKSIESQLTNS